MGDFFIGTRSAFDMPLLRRKTPWGRNGFPLSAGLAMAGCLLLLTQTARGGQVAPVKTAESYPESLSAAEEERRDLQVSEVLNHDVNYRNLFNSVRNPDVEIFRFVRPGENLKFQAKWRGLPAGYIRLTTKRRGMIRGKPILVFELDCESNDFIASFYPVKTLANSYVDAATGRSYLLRRRVSEHRREYKDRLEFEYDSRLPNGLPDPVAKYSKVAEDGREAANQPRPIPGNMQDVLSIVYYIRGLGLKKVGDSRTLLLGGGNAASLMTVSVTARETVDIPELGSFSCLVIEPEGDGANTSANILATRGAEKIWLEENTLIPVMMSAELPMPMGTVVASLVEAENSALMLHRADR